MALTAATLNNDPSLSHLFFGKSNQSAKKNIEENKKSIKYINEIREPGKIKKRKFKT